MFLYEILRYAIIIRLHDTIPPCVGRTECIYDENIQLHLQELNDLKKLSSSHEKSFPEYNHVVILMPSSACTAMTMMPQNNWGWGY